MFSLLHFGLGLVPLVLIRRIQIWVLKIYEQRLLVKFVWGLRAVFRLDPLGDAGQVGVGILGWTERLLYCETDMSLWGQRWNAAFSVSYRLGVKGSH